MRRLAPALLTLACIAPVMPAAAQSAGDWTLALGAHHVAPKSDNGTLADGTLPVSVGGSTRPTIALEYFVRDRLGIELLAAAPFRHDIDIAGLDIRAGKGKIRIDARWMDIDSEVQLDGAALGTVRIDPLVYGAAYTFSF